ncbi:MAG TPA: endonuclease/exonuclease/phosphatase family protein [Methylomirabilota bacterium]|nr:endonuclease/exonuclease/phosphatase family protein [Methylomirabilota bacterium]
MGGRNDDGGAGRGAGTNRFSVLRRAVAGALGRGGVVTGELPEDLRPRALAIVERGAAGEPLGRELTLLSYNIKRAERASRVAESLRRAVESYRPQVVLLQETPVAFFREGAAAELLAGRHLFFAPFHRVEGAQRRYPHPLYGQLTATTSPMTGHRVVELPTVNPATLGPAHTLTRIALYAELETADGRRLGLVNVHNEPFARRHRRVLQHRAFLDVVERRAPDVAVCCGDFNPSASQRGEPGIRLLEAHGFGNAFARRWRTLDTCLARGHAGFAEARRLRLPGSDHRPILVRLLL